MVTKTKKKITVGKIIGILIAVALVVALVWSYIAAAGIALRATTVAESENFKVDAAMATYFMKSSYAEFVSQYNSYLETVFKLDTTKSLKSQLYVDGTMTWHTYFLNGAKSTSQSSLVLAEAALAAGVKLEDSDYKEIDTAIAMIETYAAQYGYSTADYITQLYGKGVKVRDVRRAMELSALSSKYAEKLEAETKASDADYDEYYADNKDAVDFVDYYSYQIHVTYKTGATAEEIEAAKKDAKAIADELAKCTTPEEFAQFILDYEAELAASTEKDDDKDEDDKTEADDKADASTDTDEAVTDDKDEAADDKDAATDDKNDKDEAEKEPEEVPTVESIKEKTRTAYHQNTASDADKWLFNADRKAGDTNVVEASKNYTVYLVETPAYKSETLTKNIYTILFTKKEYETLDKAKAKAEEVLEEYKKNATLDNFSKLVYTYSEDKASSENAGLIENIVRGTEDAALEAWAFDAARAEGDVAVVETADGYEILYYAGEGMPEWKAVCADDVLTLTLEKLYTSLEEKHAVTVYEEKFDIID